jgi:RNA polymerase sigma factor (sigma-70 family)
MATDHDTITRILAGNPRQFGVLVDRYKDRGYALAWRLMGSREEAEEMVQDAFVKAYRSLAEFRGASSFGTWYYRILYNTCMTRISRRHEETVSLEDLGPVDADLAFESDDPDELERIAAEERHDILKEEIQNLPEKYRTVLTLFYVQAQRYEEIAVILSIPVNTVKTYLFRARNLLRKRIVARYSEETRAA